MWSYVLCLVIGVACGWAFFKHRAKIKQEAEQEAAQLKKSVEDRLKR